MLPSFRLKTKDLFIDISPFSHNTFYGPSFIIILTYQPSLTSMCIVLPKDNVVCLRYPGFTVSKLTV